MVRGQPRHSHVGRKMASGHDLPAQHTHCSSSAADKAHFARFGIPERLITDNGPQFISSEYKQFASEYGFEHVMSSPYWQQGNGKAEAAVKIVKRMYQKNKDIHLALLDYRNTPNRAKNTRQLKGSYPDARGAYFQ